MVKTIWKFPFSINDRFELRMPVGAKLLTVQIQYGTPCIWAMVDPKAEQETRTFWVYGTGHPIEQAGAREYVGTMQDGPLVWHVFRELGSLEVLMGL